MQLVRPRQVLDGKIGNDLSNVRIVCGRKLLVRIGAGVHVLAVRVWNICHCACSHVISYLYSMCSGELLVRTGIWIAMPTLQSRTVFYRSCSNVIVDMHIVCCGELLVGIGPGVGMLAVRIRVLRHCARRHVDGRMQSV